MRLQVQTSISFIVLMSITMGLGACAAHKRDNATGVRAANASKVQQKAQAPTVTGSDWKSILSADNQGTYQLQSYNLQIVKNNETAPVLAEGALEASPIVSGTLPAKAPAVFITLKKDGDTKDSDIASVLNKIPPVINEFSAADGTIVTMRGDVLDLKDATSGQYEETITISQGSGKASDDTKWTSLQNKVQKLENGSVEVDRVAPLDAEKTMMTKEKMIFVLKTSATTTSATTTTSTTTTTPTTGPTGQVAAVNADTKLQTPNAPTSAAQQ